VFKKSIFHIKIVFVLKMCEIRMNAFLFIHKYFLNETKKKRLNNFRYFKRNSFLQRGMKIFTPLKVIGNYLY